MRRKLGLSVQRTRGVEEGSSEDETDESDAELLFGSLDMPGESGHDVSDLANEGEEKATVECWVRVVLFAS